MSPNRKIQIRITLEVIDVAKNNNHWNDPLTMRRLSRGNFKFVCCDSPTEIKYFIDIVWV